MDRSDHHSDIFFEGSQVSTMAAGVNTGLIKCADSMIASVPVVCQECQEDSFRYQCPRCSHRTCSLKCCLAHKKRTGCNGKRDRTKFLPVCRMNDGTLANDYHFLEDVLGAVERAKRTVGTAANTATSSKKFKSHHPNQDSNDVNHTTAAPHSMLQQIENLKVGNNSNESTLSTEATSSHPQSTAAAATSLQLQPNCCKELGPKWRHFWQQASLRGINLLLMPSGMQRRKANLSYIKKDAIHWKVDFRIHSLQLSLDIQSRKLSEQTILWDILQSLDLGSCQYHYLMQKLPSPSNRPCFIELCDQQATLQDILKGMTIIEYPTIDVVPASRLAEFPKAIEEVDEKALPVVAEGAQEQGTLP
jgi:hypothetical protein